MNIARRNREMEKDRPFRWELEEERAILADYVSVILEIICRSTGLGEFIKRIYFLHCNRYKRTVTENEKRKSR